MTPEQDDDKDAAYDEIRHSSCRPPRTSGNSPGKGRLYPDFLPDTAAFSPGMAPVNPAEGDRARVEEGAGRACHSRAGRRRRGKLEDAKVD
jgi:hypothetical protein